MKCDKIREMLIADHMDDENDPGMQAVVEDHLKGCSACREFYEVLIEKVSGPFRSVQPLRTPEGTWENIEQRISAVAGGKFDITILWDKVKIFPLLRKPAIALVSVMLFAFVGVKYFDMNSYNTVKGYLDEQINLLSSLQSDVNAAEFGTSIEEYFL